jgi:hemerythrin-like domain-containing protein
METNTKPQELITLLREQHRTLGIELTNALEAAKDATALRDEEIVAYLNTFRNDLTEHLKIENVVFYPDYLNKKSKIKENVAYAQELIKQMDEIAVAVLAFLDTYNSVTSIERARAKFISELATIMDTLRVRIETEDEIFDLYLLL